MSGLEGTTLSHYHLKHLLGKGGMSEVYLAYDEHQHCDVAVKVVHKNQTEYVERFQREVTAMRAFTHDHILPALDAGRDGSWHYLVMPYLAQGTLRERLKTQGPLTMEEAGIILEQLASALQYAHEHGMLHRDIKSANILLRDEQYAYLADFGLAKVVEERSDITRTGYVMGTVEYMAPELAEGPASTSSDIYALSILLYEMVTGNVPFRGGTSLGVYVKHQVEQPIRPSLHNPTLSSPVEQVILRALEKDPHKRLKTPRALAQTYSHALQVSAQSPTLPVLASNKVEEAPTVATRFSPQLVNSRKAIAALALLVVLLAASLALGFFMYDNSQITAVQGIKGASTQFDTSSGIEPSHFTPTVITSTNTPTPPTGNKDGHRHRHKKGN